MEWVELILRDLLPTVVGVIGGTFGIIYWRENKALLQQNVKAKSAEVSDKLVDVELKEAEEWRRLYEEERARNTEKSQRLKSLYAERDDLKEKLNGANFRVQQLSWYHCTVNGCHHRRPPHIFDKNGNEIEATESKEK